MKATATRCSRKLVALLMLGPLLFVRPSLASCSPPEISVDRRELAAGEGIVVSGGAWADGCAEPREGGCGRAEQREPSALADVEVTLVAKAGARPSIVLGSIDAGGDYEFKLETVVPRSTPPGRYTIEARSGDAVNESPVPIVVKD